MLYVNVNPKLWIIPFECKFQAHRITTVLQKLNIDGAPDRTAYNVSEIRLEFLFPFICCYRANDQLKLFTL